MRNPKRKNIEGVAHTSPDLLADQAAKLRDLFPECVTEGRIDFDRLRATLGEEIEGGPERFSFSWAGKPSAIRLLQATSRGTLAPQAKKSIRFDETHHLFIEGENLEVLKLLYKPYFGAVKMIYIDPPYNTGNDFIYQDDFKDPLDAYLRYTAQEDESGNRLTSNPETGGRYHSAWLSMMYPRLFVARQLLRDDGVIFVSIDDHEVHNLRMVTNEVFGEENFVAVIVAQTNPRGRTLDRFLAKTHEYILVFARDITQQAIVQVPKGERALAEYDQKDSKGQYRELELRNRNPVFNRKNRPNMFYPFYADPKTSNVSLTQEAPFTVEILPLNSKGEEGCWTWHPPTAQKNIDMLVARKVNTGAWRVFRKDYVPKEGATTKEKALWLDKNINHENGKEELGRLFGTSPFDFPKSVELVKKCVRLGTTKQGGDIVLDFFGGSGTTAQAVLELNREDEGNRRFVVVEMAEPSAEERWPTIAEVTKERVRRVIARMQKEGAKKPDRSSSHSQDLGFRVFRLRESNYRPWTGLQEFAPAAYAKTMELFTDPLVPGWDTDGVIWEVAVKEGYSLGSRVEHVGGLKGLKGNVVYRVTDADKGQSLFVCLDDKVKKDAVRMLALKRDDVFVCLDAALDDATAANLALQCRLKTI